MIVNVSYTVDMEKIPELIQEIMASIKRNVSDCSGRLSFNPNNFNKMIKDCEDFRRKLDVIDSQLVDIVNITAGWLQAVETDPQESSQDREGAASDEGTV